MKKEDLKKEIEQLRENRNYFISEDIWKRFQKGECNLISNLVNEVFDLIKYTTEIENKRAELKGFQAGQLAERERCLKIIEPREFNENITKIMNKNGFVTYDDNECIWVCCNIIKNYLKEELTKKVKEERE